MNSDDVCFRELNKTVLEVCNHYDFPNDIGNIFSTLRNSKIFSDLIKNKTNEYQNYENELIYDFIFIKYFYSNKFFNPKFIYHIDDQLFDSSRPRFCLSLHSNFSPLIAILKRENTSFIIHADSPKISVNSISLASGLKSGSLEFIKRDHGSLLKMKYFLDRNYLISSTIDFRHRTTPGIFNMLSDSILKLASLTHTETYFGISTVNNFGEVTYRTKKIGIGENIDSIKKEILETITDFKNSSSYSFSKFEFLKKNSNSRLNILRKKVRPSILIDVKVSLRRKSFRYWRKIILQKLIFLILTTSFFSLWWLFRKP
jgi:hypothetical protein